MPIHNSDVANIFNQVADLLDIEGANIFRIRAYRDAARTVKGLSKRVEDMVKEKEDLQELPGIGKDLAKKIEEIVETGSLEFLEEIKKRTNPELAKMLSISGLGPKKVSKINKELEVEKLEQLQEAAEKHKIQELEGFGKKSEEKILKALKTKKEEAPRSKLISAEEIAEPLFEYLEDDENVDKIAFAGSYRRHKETVGDLDILVTSENPKEVMEHFTSYEDVEDIQAKGKTKSTVILRSGFQVDLRVVEKESYGAALIYFTGSKAHNIKLRNLALDKDLKINEYGVFKNDEDKIAGKTEEEIYDIFDMPYIEPELREDRGEVEAAREGKLPKLLTLADMRGDLQAHSTNSDGHNSLQEMAEAAKEKGYEYLAMTDHSQSVRVANGLDEKRLGKEIDEINKLNEKIKDIRILKSIEVDILKDGSLDLDDSILKKLDFVLCAIHSYFNLSLEDQTNRILKAMDNKYFNILAHPTGRKIGDRKPYDLDMEKIMEAAKEKNCILEIDAHPVRLDINDHYAKMAKDMGVKISISTDAHAKNELAYMKYGVWQARRGWLEKDDVINTRSWNGLKKIFKR